MSKLFACFGVCEAVCDSEGTIEEKGVEEEMKRMDHKTD